MKIFHNLSSPLNTTLLALEGINRRHTFDSINTGHKPVCSFPFHSFHAKAHTQSLALCLRGCEIYFSLTLANTHSLSVSISLSISRSLIRRFTTPLKIKMPLFMPHSKPSKVGFLVLATYHRSQTDSFEYLCEDIFRGLHV